MFCMLILSGYHFFYEAKLYIYIYIFSSIKKGYYVSIKISIKNKNS